MRKIVFTGAALALAASALLAASPAAFASTPTLNIPAPGIQSFSAIPDSWFLLNQPDEFTVTLGTTAAPPTSQSSTTTTYETKTGWRYVISGFNQSYQYQATGRYWVNSGYWATGSRWVNSGYNQSYGYWQDTSHWKTNRYWVTSGYEHYWTYWWYRESQYNAQDPAGEGCAWAGTSNGHWTWHCHRTYHQWINTSHWSYYSYWVNSGYWATTTRWINTSHWQSYSYWQNTSHWQSYQYTATGTRWINTSHWQSYQYTVPVVTTVADTGISIAKETLVGVQPIIQDTTPGTYYGQEWYGTFCYGGQTPLIPPAFPNGQTNPAFPNFSGQLWKYTYFFEQQHICTFNPTYVANNNVQSWWVAGNMARMVLIPEYSITATYTQTTTVNGTVTSIVPKTVTETVNGPTFYGPPWKLYAISSISCAVQNGLSYCPGQPPVRVP